MRKNDRILPEIIGTKALARPHRQSDRPVRATDRLALDFPEELSDGGFLHIAIYRSNLLSLPFNDIYYTTIHVPPIASLQTKSPFARIGG
jgi:hypothetical protein